jgi:hypothetical protein
MKLFGRKAPDKRCPECRSYAMVEGYGYCGKDLDPSINLRMISAAAIKRQCPRCPKEMTCDAWAPK